MKTTKSARRTAATRDPAGNDNDNGAAHFDNINDVTRRIGDNFAGIREELADRTEELRAAASRSVAENPLASMAVAFGVGYLVSGALFSRTSMRVASLAGRLLVGAALKQLFVGVSPGAIVSALAGDEPQR